MLYRNFFVTLHRQRDEFLLDVTKWDCKVTYIFCYISKKLRTNLYANFYSLMRVLDLQRIRLEKNISQVKLAELTDYPQSFISVIERGKASAPQELIDKVVSLFGIENIDDYISEVANPNLKKKVAKRTKRDGKSTEPTDDIDLAATASPEQAIVSNFLELLKKKEEKIEKLEAENEALKQEIARLKLQTSELTSD